MASGGPDLLFLRSRDYEPQCRSLLIFQLNSLVIQSYGVIKYVIMSTGYIKLKSISNIEPLGRDFFSCFALSPVVGTHLCPTWDRGAGGKNKMPLP